MKAGDPSLPRLVLRDPVHWFAFGFGAGLLPAAPGTWGSVVGVALYALLPPLASPILATLLGVIFIAGCWICDVSSKKLGGLDHPGIVLDEILGMMLVLTTVPHRAGWWLAAFAAFRAFDILKPWPIREVDHRLRNGAGIMLDDVLAAAYAAVLLSGLREIAAL